MKERDILFKGEMVRAVLDDRKNQTRRLNGLEEISKSPDEWDFHRVQDGYPDGRDRFVFYPKGDGEPIGLVCPKGQAGDRLWVKETSIIAPKRFATPDDSCVTDYDGDPRFIQYLATHPKTEAAQEWYKLKKTPSIFMPRWASRITLEIVSVRVERLNEISEADAIAEGVNREWSDDGGETPGRHLYFTDADEEGKGHAIAREAYRVLWESINGEGSWAANPFVWVIEFKRLNAPAS